MAAILRCSRGSLLGTRNVLRPLASSLSFELHKKQKNCKYYCFMVLILWFSSVEMFEARAQFKVKIPQPSNIKAL